MKLWLIIHRSRSWSRSRFIFEGSEPEPLKIGRLRNSGLYGSGYAPLHLILIWVLDLEKYWILWIRILNNDFDMISINYY